MNWQLVQESRLLDPAAVARLRELGGDDLLHEVERLFRPVAEARIRALHRAVSSADRDALGRAAQSLHGTASNIGARQLMRRATELESLARSGGRREWRPVIAEIELETRQICHVLTAEDSRAAHDRGR